MGLCVLQQGEGTGKQLTEEKKIRAYIHAYIASYSYHRALAMEIAWITKRF